MSTTETSNKYAVTDLRARRVGKDVVMVSMTQPVYMELSVAEGRALVEQLQVALAYPAPALDGGAA